MTTADAILMAEIDRRFAQDLRDRIASRRRTLSTPWLTLPPDIRAEFHRANDRESTLAAAIDARADRTDPRIAAPAPRIAADPAAPRIAAVETAAVETAA